MVWCCASIIMDRIGYYCCRHANGSGLVAKEEHDRAFTRFDLVEFGLVRFGVVHMVVYANGSRLAGKEEHDRECRPGVAPTYPDLTNSFASV